MHPETLAAQLLREGLGARPLHEVLDPEGKEGVRLLITGSREWTDVQAIKDALRPWWKGGRTTLVHGACPRGADNIADRIWRGAEGRVDPWPANWQKYHRAAGHRRNAAMVRGGADVAIAFLCTDRPSPGTRGCIELIRAAHIPLTIITSP